jgi:hypothetical protein
VGEGILYLLKDQKHQNGVVGAGDVGVVLDVASEASVLVLAGFQPGHDFLLLAFW